MNVLRDELFKPQLKCDDLHELNAYLHDRCEALSSKAHPDKKGQTINTVFAEERLALRATGKPFDGYIEKPVKVTSTCLVQVDNNYYSVPCDYAKKPVLLRLYANRILVTADQQVIAEHQRSFNRHEYCFEPWHYVPLLARKPGALRNGAPFATWDLPEALHEIKAQYLKRSGGDKDFVSLLQLIEQYSLDEIATACELAIEAKTIHLPAIINILHRLTEDTTTPAIEVAPYPVINEPPEAHCARYDQLRAGGVA